MARNRTRWVMVGAAAVVATLAGGTVMVAHNGSSANADPVPACVNAGSLLTGYEVAYQIDLPVDAQYSGRPNYAVDRSAALASGIIDRVGYCLELDGRWAAATMTAPLPDVKKLGIPAYGTGIRQQIPVSRLNVRSNVAGVPVGDGLKGNMEFWPSNYNTFNRAGVAGAVSTAYDAGDEMTAPDQGYGSMQIHGSDNRPIISYNRFGYPGTDDLGIGRAPTGHLDWTFAQNAAQFRTRRLTVFVRRAGATVVDNGGLTDGALIPRAGDATEAGTTIAGEVQDAGVAAVVARVYGAAGALVSEQRFTPGANRPAPFRINVAIPAKLTSHRVEVVAEWRNGSIRPIHRADNVVAGDVYVIQGQSNSVGWTEANTDATDASPFIRSFGTTSLDPAVSTADRRWYQATSYGPAKYGPGRIGVHGLRFGRVLIERTKVPVAIISGGKGGEPISHFQRQDATPTSPATNYGRLLLRLQAARLTGAVKGIIWYQGESDGSRADVHRAGFLAMREDWKADYPNVRLIEVNQVRANGCGSNTVELKDAQRRLGRDNADITTVSTEGVPEFDGCHYGGAGYRTLGERWAAVAIQKLYGGADSDGIYSPDVWAARFTSTARNEVEVQFADADDTLRLNGVGNLSIRNGAAPIAVTGGTVTAPGRVTLRLASPAAPNAVLTVMAMNATPNVVNAKGIGIVSGLTTILEPGAAIPQVDPNVAR